MDPQSPSQIGLDEAYSVKTPEDNRRLYAKWAATYESGFVDARKYRYPRTIAEVFGQAVPSQGVEAIIDIGTGTGLAGTYLSALRPGLAIDGVDISVEMLAQARAKTRADQSSVYRELFEADLTEPLGELGGPYDALISSGTFTHGHLGPSAIANLITLVRPSGWFVIGVNNEHFVGQGFAQTFEELVAQGSISAPEIRVIDVYEPGSPHFGDQARIAIFTRK